MSKAQIHRAKPGYLCVCVAYLLSFEKDTSLSSGRRTGEPKRCPNSPREHLFEGKSIGYQKRDRRP